MSVLGRPLPLDQAATQQDRVDPANRASRALPLIAGIVAAEFSVVYVNPFVGALIHAVILCGVLWFYLGAPDTAVGRAALGLSLVPVLRLLSFGMVVPDMPYPVWLVLVGTPLALSAAFVFRSTRTSLTKVLLARSAVPGFGTNARPLAAITGAGLALGLIATFTIDRGLVPLGDAADVAITAIALALFVAVLEEVVFRGLIQGLLRPVFGIAAVPLVATVYASTYLGVLSAGYLLVVSAFGLAAGWYAYRYGSLVGPIAGHVALSVGAFVVWPALLN